MCHRAIDAFFIVITLHLKEFFKLIFIYNIRSFQNKSNGQKIKTANT
ncbi:hypothetical protein CHCC20333_1406 [Bacillus paralicheniformis]|nr:hypothetical protein CHCC20333_1406 [Bacillus paralicheniformis]